MKNILSIVVLTCLLAACTSGKHFTSRKYTSGRYVSHAAHKERINKNTSNSEKLVAIKKPIVQKAEIPQKKTENRNVIVASVDAPVSVKAKSKNNAGALSDKKVESLKKKNPVQGFNKKTFKKLPAKTISVSEGKPGTKSLISTILSAVGLIIDVAGVVLSIAALDYVFLLLFPVGLTLGIIGLVLGLQGIKEYRSDKHNGNDNKSTLILGIVGTSLGGAAIIAAVVFCLWSAIIISLSY